MSKLYPQSPSVQGLCEVCGDSEVYKHKAKKGSKTYYTPWYSRVFEKTNWFRGDDVYVGQICRICLKAGKMEELYETN